MRTMLVLLVSLGAACSPKSSISVPSDEAGKLLIDRNWIDRMPQTHEDKLHVYRFVPNMGGGVFQDRTLFKGTFELFKFKIAGDHIEFDLPQTRQKATSQFRIETVAGPAPFDLKLTIFSDPRGSRVYYGIRSETDRDGQLLERRLE